MINFFRKIRKQLANENKFQKYFRYAFGEVTLIMIGIFMALQLNNWNEARKQDAQFNVTLEQLYSSITYDVQKLESHIGIMDRQIEDINFYIEKPDPNILTEFYLAHQDSIIFKEIPYYLHWIAQDFSIFHISETKYYAEDLNYNANNKSQNEIYKHIINYANEIKIEYPFKDYLNSLYIEYNIATPKANKSNANNVWDRSDSLYYNNNDIFNAIKLINTNEFKTAFKNTRNNKIYYRAILLNRLNDAKSILQLIRNYYPEVKVLYQDVGIIGTSLDGFDDVGGKSTPMLLSDIENDIWEIENIYLKEGEAKFRCRDSWAQNWGGEDFPNGIGELDGANIAVNKAGNYHIIFKPITGEYEFIKLNE